jgi:hypothetical protein
MTSRISNATEGISGSYLRGDGFHRFECQCTTFDHNIRFEVDSETGDISISVPLNHWLPWWKRMILAVKYVFMRTERYGHYDTVQLNPHDYPRIRALLDDSEKKMRSW